MFDQKAFEKNTAIRAAQLMLVSGSPDLMAFLIAADIVDAKHVAFEPPPAGIHDAHRTAFDRSIPEILNGPVHIVGEIIAYE
ncbi:MAG: hypothetical protein ABL907_09665 [Hyphomicrobium sp.]